MVKLAVGAILATMLVRFPWFRRILLTEKRDWPERLIFAASLGLPLTAGVLAAAAPQLQRRRPDARRVVPRRAARRAVRRRHRRGHGRHPARSSPANGSRCPSRSAAASPAAACARSARRKRSGTSRRSSSPSCTGTSGGWSAASRSTGSSSCSPRRSASRSCGRRWAYHWPNAPHFPPAGARRRWRCAFVIPLATVLCVAIPIKIWNSARIEHRLQEQEKLLMAARIEALASQINPHFLFNTLTSISSLIRSQPETARMLIVKLSGLLRRLLRSQEHFVTLREELEAIDEYLDIEAVRFGPELRVEKDIDPPTPRHRRPEHAAAAARRELDQARPLAEGRRRAASRSGARRENGHASSTSSTTGSASDDRNADRVDRHRHRPEQRQRAAARDLRRQLPAPARQRARRRHVRAHRHP